MTQEQWAARVAEIGAMAGWHAGRISLLSGLPPGYGILSWMEDALDTTKTPAVITAIRQLAADWLASEGVVASRWRAGTPGKLGAYWCEVDALTQLNTRFLMLQWDGKNWLKKGWPYERKTLQWQELDGINYEVSHE